MLKQKYITLKISFCFFLFLNLCYCQTRNYLTKGQFENIKVDGISLKQIVESNGEIKKMSSLFGNTLKYKKVYEPNESIGFWDKGFYFDFEDRSGNGTFELVNFSIDDSISIISINNNDITIGSSIRNMKGVTVSNYDDGTKGIIYAIRGHESEAIFISFNTHTKRILKIEFISFD